MNMEPLSEKTKIIKLALIRLGIKSDYIGFDYLEKAVEYAIDEPNAVYNVKKMFTKIADQLKTTNAQQIESNIQNAINTTYNNRGFDSINDLFGLQIIKPDHKPTVGELIKIVSEYYLLKIYEHAI